MAHQYLTASRPQQRAFSRAVVTEGGRTIWLAGQTATTDAEGKSLAGDFDAQARGVFSALQETLSRAGSSLSDIVTMTVFLKDIRDGDRFVEIRREIFEKDFPASALVMVTAFAQPSALLEVQAIAVAP
jgi:2-iminobutanoate/2-iminopropanoate deaminase